MKLSNLFEGVYCRLEKRIQILLGYRYYKDFKKYKNKKKIIHMLTPIHGNMGDQAIVYATNEFLKKNYSDYTIIEIYKKDILKVAKAIKKILNKGDFIVLIGGGNMNNIWLNEEVDRRFVIKYFPKTKIVSMPQTIGFTDDYEGKRQEEKTKRIYNRHKNLTLIARENVSYIAMKKMFINAKVLINPDMVLYLNNIYTGNEFERRGIMTCFRDDKESILNNDKNLIIEKLKLDYDNVFNFDTVLNKTIIRENRKEELTKVFTKFLKSKLVITDRLHGMIFCTITKTPCIVTKSFDHKIAGTYEWIKDLNYIKFVENLDYDTLKKLIEELINLKSIKGIDFDDTFFYKLKGKIGV